MLLPRLLLAPVLLASAAVAADRAADPRPNIIVILADDLGWGDLGCYGQAFTRTPNLDRMAAEGMRFTQFYAGSAICGPSRCVLMTGLHTGHARIRGNQHSNLLPEDETVAKLLRRAGYATGLIGKWGLGENSSLTGLPSRQGFDYFFGYRTHQEAHNHFPPYLWRNDERVPLPNPVDPAHQGYTDHPVVFAEDRFLDEALRFLDDHRAQPFFLYFASALPHANNERFWATGDGMEVPDYGAYATQPWPDPNKGLAAMITRLDRDVGRLLAHLRELGLADNTLVLFASDNGPHHEGGQDMAILDSNGRWRGIKRDLTEGGLRVPGIAWWPGQIAPGQVSDQVGGFQDLLPTAAELARVKPIAPTDGLSLVPALRGQAQAPRPVMYWEITIWGSNQAVLLDGRWKAIRMSFRHAPLVLYDLANDPDETVDMAAQHPDLIARAETAMKAEHVDAADAPLVDAGPKPPADPTKRPPWN